MEEMDELAKHRWDSRLTATQASRRKAVQWRAQQPLGSQPFRSLVGVGGAAWPCSSHVDSTGPPPSPPHPPLEARIQRETLFRTRCRASIIVHTGPKGRPEGRPRIFLEPGLGSQASL